MIKGKTQKKITLKKLKGYLAIFRNHILFLKEKKLTLTELGAYHTFLLTADWDRNHSTLGIILDPQELESLTEIDSTTWSRYRKRFINDGYLEELDGGGVRVKNFWIHIPGYAKQLAKQNIESLQEKDAIVKSGIAIVQDKIASLQLPVKERADGVASDNNDNSSKTHDAFAELQVQNPSKENLNKPKENLNNRDASHPHSPSLVSSYKSKQEIIHQVVLESYPDADSENKTNCQGCNKRLESESIIEHSLKSYGYVLCYMCSSSVRSKLKARKLM